MKMIHSITTLAASRLPVQMGTKNARKNRGDRTKRDEVSAMGRVIVPC
jgi:hypothetical protein